LTPANLVTVTVRRFGQMSKVSVRIWKNSHLTWEKSIWSFRHKIKSKIWKNLYV